MDGSTNSQPNTLPTLSGYAPQRRPIVDLLVPFRQFAHYHPDQHGSCSIKAVLPALCGTTYDDLEIGKGDEASREYVRVTYSDVPYPERERSEKHSSFTANKTHRP